MGRHPEYSGPFTFIQPEIPEQQVNANVDVVG
jgi:hypothetical protein